LLFHPGKRITRIDPLTRKVVDLITLSDLFSYFVDDEMEDIIE
jgi:hypothetical protein